MRIFIDIGHPAHVHYFKNFIEIMKNKNHDIRITARNKEIEYYLLKKYNIHFIGRGKGGKTTFGKLISLFKNNIIILIKSILYKPNVYLSFASPYAAQVSQVLRKPHIAIDDTEHAKFSHKLTYPFSDVILTPSSYIDNIGDKQIRFNGFMELCYLHDKYFKPDNSILKYLKLNEDECFIVLRFVSWNATHDVGHKALSLENKMHIVKELSRTIKVFISSEDKLPEEFKQYELNIPPEKLHDLLYFSTLYIGEGATTASECAILGTPAIYVNSIDAGTLQEQEKYGLLFGFRDSNGVLEKAIELLNMPNLKQEFQNRRHKMLSEKIDVTAFLVWFVENYPKSVKIMKGNPDYQYNFK